MVERSSLGTLTLIVATLGMIFMLAVASCAHPERFSINSVEAALGGPCVDHVPADGTPADPCDGCGCCNPSRAVPEAGSQTVPSVTTIRVARPLAAATPGGLPQDVAPRPPRPATIG